MKSLPRVAIPLTIAFFFAASAVRGSQSLPVAFGAHVVRLVAEGCGETRPVSLIRWLVPPKMCPGVLSGKTQITASIKNTTLHTEVPSGASPGRRHIFRGTTHSLKNAGCGETRESAQVRGFGQGGQP